jgi:hypothetical protein
VSAHDTTDDAEIRALVTRLARPHPSGGDVVERAALLASGGDFAAVLAWIADRAGVPEELAPEAPRRGLHGPRLGLSGGTGPRTPTRFVLPAGTLT